MEQANTSPLDPWYPASRVCLPGRAPSGKERYRMDCQSTVLTIITHSGDARSLAMKAISLAREGQFAQAQGCIEEAAHRIGLAHREQTSLIQSEAQGVKQDLSLLLVHAQDHLMNAIVVRDLAAEFVELYRMVKQDRNGAGG